MPNRRNIAPIIRFRIFDCNGLTAVLSDAYFRPAATILSTRAVALKSLKCRRLVRAAAVAQQLGQKHCILQRERSTLPSIGTDGVRGIADQDDPPIVPARQRLDVEDIERNNVARTLDQTWYGLVVRRYRSSNCRRRTSGDSDLSSSAL